MGYIPKQLLQKAYKTLSDLTDDHKQGQTQIVSAIRYLVALDMFYKKKDSKSHTVINHAPNRARD